MAGWMSLLYPHRIWPWLPRDQLIQSEWWLPERPECAVRGNLTIPQFGHPRLHFEGGDELLQLPQWKFDILYGRIWDLANTPATVLRSFSQPRDRGYALNTGEVKELRTVDITINRLLIGRHLSSENKETCIASASLVSPYLHGWAEFDSFERPTMPDQSPFELKFTPQRTERVTVSDRTVVHFDCILHRSSAIRRPDQIQLRQYTVANLTFSNPLSLASVQTELDKLVTFISFCLRRPVNEWDIFLEFEPAAAPADQLEQQSGALIQAFSQFEAPEYNPALVRRLDLGEELPTTLKAWWSSFDEFSPALAHHLTTLGEHIPYVHVRFINLVQGLEAYHRRFHKGKYEPETLFKKGLYRVLKDAVPQSLPKPYEDAVFAKLRRLHEYTLETRLRELFAKNQRILEFGFRSVDQEIARIRKVRNDLTHGKSPFGMDAYELFRLEDQCRLLLEGTILSRLTTNVEMARRQLECIYLPSLRGT